LPDAYGTPGPGDPPANEAPSVTLTAPLQGQQFNTPATVSVSANAADADGSIARVEFLVNGAIVATDTSSPYSASWTTTAPGTYAVSARAVDNVGAATTSPAASVTVQQGGATPGQDVVLW